MRFDVVNSNVNIKLPVVKTVGYSKISEKPLIYKKNISLSTKQLVNCVRDRNKLPK
jgi:hypothetical protein